MKKVVNVSWSGGKDSTCATYLYLTETDFTVNVINFVPMFTDKIPMITKKHFEFIQNQASIFKELGANIYFAYPKVTFYNYCISNGYPFFSNCGYRFEKINAINSASPFSHFDDVGIAFDEVKRYCVLGGKKVSILFDKRYTENDCLLYCYMHSALSPHYLYSKRDGCSLCPNASDIQRLIWLNDYPEAIPLISELDSIVKSKFNKNYLIYPLRGYKNYLDFLGDRLTSPPLLGAEHNGSTL